MTTPADELRAAAEKLRQAVAALPANDWGNRPWHAEECSDTDTMESCPCIVAQGEYRDFDQPQDRPMQYVADAESPEHAAYIALMGPDVGQAIVALLDHEAYRLSIAAPGWQHEADPYALAVARALNGDAR